MDKVPRVASQESNRKHPRSLIVLTIPIPLLSSLLVAVLFLVVRQMMSDEWAIHVDGHGNITYGSSWSVFIGAFVLTFLAFLLGQYLARDFNNLGHWYPQQKGIVVACFSTGYGSLGFLIGNMVSAAAVPKTTTAETSIGYGLLGFLLASIIAAICYTKFLPRAKKINGAWSPQNGKVP